MGVRSQSRLEGEQPCNYVGRTMPDLDQRLGQLTRVRRRPGGVVCACASGPGFTLRYRDLVVQTPSHRGRERPGISSTRLEQRMDHCEVDALPHLALPVSGQHHAGVPFLTNLRGQNAHPSFLCPTRRAYRRHPPTPICGGIVIAERSEVRPTSTPRDKAGRGGGQQLRDSWQGAVCRGSRNQPKLALNRVRLLTFPHWLC